MSFSQESRVLLRGGVPLLLGGCCCVGVNPIAAWG